MTVLLDERKEIIKFSLKMVSSGLTTGSGGNLSIFNRSKGLIAITPSGIEYSDLTPKDIILLDLQGNICPVEDTDHNGLPPDAVSSAHCSGHAQTLTNEENPAVPDCFIGCHANLKPSSEWGFHLALYRHRADINAVVHTHSPYATTFACLNREIPPVHYLVAFAGKKVPVAPYATFGTSALADNILATINDYNAILLANHGLVAVGITLPDAFNTAEETEFVARVCFQAESLGRPVLLPDDEMDRVIDKFKHYGSGRK
ncbi:MAG: class II aldolase/adducin family protein [Desulfamplus sp.]|nr:class II aldolase/adducin family protein [Desulfamplus sp.]